jgi:hypothetical protein
VKKVITNISDREAALIRALRAIIIETMDYPSTPHYDSESYLPADFIGMAIKALSGYGVEITPSPMAVFGGEAA